MRNADFGIANLDLCSPMPTISVKRSTFDSNMSADINVWLDATRSPSAVILNNWFHDRMALQLAVAYPSMNPVATATISSNFFYSAPTTNGFGALDLRGGWQGQITGNTFTVAQAGALGILLNQGQGSCLAGSGNYASPSVSINNNRFSVFAGSNRYALKTAFGPVTQIDARNNDWRYYTSDEIASVIVDRFDEAGRAEALFLPWSSSPGGGGGGGGCPFVLTESGAGFEVENSILGRSGIEGESGGFVSDAYPLKGANPGTDQHIRLRIAELELETDEIDELALASVQVPEGFRLAADGAGKPVAIRPIDLPVRARAWSGKQAPSASPIGPGSSYHGEPGDSVEFEVQAGSMVGVSSIGQRIGAQLIPKPPLPAAPLGGKPIGITVRVSTEIEGNRWITLDPVIPREFWSTEVISLDDLNGEVVRRVRIIWHTQHTLGWLGLVEAKEVEPKVVPCLSAVNSRGRSVLPEIGARDGQKATLTPGEHVELEFDASGVPVGSQYLLQAYGRYFRTGNESAPAAPAAHFLAQNRPNPFNPSTTIEFGLPAPTPVTLRVYNVAGRKIRTLISKQMPAGFHTVRWDSRDDRGSTVSSGVYFYELRGRAFIDRRRMVLLR